MQSVLFRLLGRVLVHQGGILLYLLILGSLITTVGILRSYFRRYICRFSTSLFFQLLLVLGQLGFRALFLLVGARVLADLR